MRKIEDGILRKKATDLNLVSTDQRVHNKKTFSYAGDQYTRHSHCGSV